LFRLNTFRPLLREAARLRRRERPRRRLFRGSRSMWATSLIPSFPPHQRDQPWSRSGGSGRTRSSAGREPRLTCSRTATTKAGRVLFW